MDKRETKKTIEDSPLYQLIMFPAIRYAMMLDCWKKDPDERPSFGQLISTLERMMTADTPYHDFDKLDETKACYSEQAQPDSDK